MSKRSRFRRAQGAQAKPSPLATLPLPPTSSPLAYGPAAPVIPPPDGITLRLGLGNQSLIVDLPSGRSSELTIGPDALDLLVGILRRARGEARESIIAAAPPAPIRWPKGTPIRFCPPNPSPWREAAFFPSGADFCSMIVECEHRDGSIVAKGPDGKVYSVSAKWVRVDGHAVAFPQGVSAGAPAGRKNDARAALVLTLEDLGL